MVNCPWLPPGMGRLVTSHLGATRARRARTRRARHALSLCSKKSGTTVTKAIRRYELGYGQYQHQVDFLQRTPWSPLEARDRIFAVFAQKILPVRLFHQVATPYLERMETCTAWEVLNSFTNAMKKLTPAVQFDATVKLGRFFSQPSAIFSPPRLESPLQ